MQQPNHWQPLLGDFTITNGQIHFTGGENPPTDPASATAGAIQLSTAYWGIAMSNLYFSGGLIELHYEYRDGRSIPWIQIIFYRDSENEAYVAAGLEGWHSLDPNFASHGRFVISQFDKNSGFKLLAGTAYVKQPSAANGNLKLRLNGSVIDLYANEVQVLRHYLTPTLPPTQCGLLCRSTDSVDVRDYAVQTRSRTAFVVMQFSPPFEHLFAEVIKPVCDACGYRAEKADDVVGPGLIIADIIRKIIEADLIIAEITPENQNVFYEVGYAHAIGKPTILLADKTKKLPFDVSGFRTLFYENSIGGKAQIDAGLRRHIEAIGRERSPL